MYTWLRLRESRVAQHIQFEFVGKFGKWEFHKNGNTIYFGNLIVGSLQTTDPIETKLILKKWFNEKLLNYNNQIAKVEAMKAETFTALSELDNGDIK